MAGQTATMEFPVSINAQISNLKDLRTTLINTLNAAGKDSSLAKTLTKDLAKVNQLISEAEEFTLSPTIDAAGLKALEGTFNKFFRQMQTSLQTIDLASFEQIASADDIARLKELTAEAAKYRRELEAINKSGSAEQTGKVLERTGNQDIAKRGSTYKEFNATATLNKNAAAMSKAADAYAQQAAAMQAGIDKLAQELSQAEANSEKAKNKAKILEQNLAAVNIDTRAADFHHKAGRFATNYSAEQNVKNPTLDTIQSGLRATLESVYAGGKIATDMRATVKDWIKNLLPDVKDVDADNMVKKSVNDLLEDLMEGIFGSDYRSNPNLSYNVHHARILGNAQSYSAREIGRINAQYGVSGGQDLKVISAGISQELKQVRAEEKEYTSEVDKKLTSWDEATDRQKEFTEAAAGARQLANELENLAKAEQEAARAAKEAQIEENEQNQLDLKNARTSGVKNSGAPGRQNMSDYKTEAKEVFDDAGEVLGGKQAQIDEAAQFTANLKQSIKSWMSAQQIINIVKQGIRQAYQDIQNLDKAMTNIAVVTDMSVGDLWGKINEYMSIAQQYGVSTQGVYEVSQLYYQQGLGTADVMAATTETLKMARIAGMDYAEAADAMTVAIRSFKMEMSDAAHVTDVYSKVAAVTASDSEELAIAMSKTASSAESVGSSFENTTAMLAVMIETTRESAQNLGSALKSIISRYGEMKVGMTVDSEGEALDYNKVDTALQSVGISLKDAQGQFRDFDEVIFELSEKWDSLDSVTQRYIATIMAGNRQQSRFIALVDNWERLNEVAGAAQDSEDAGLLQYAKTLDSLETKITNIKTSFQEFYMSLVNGPVVGAALEGINNILKGFNKLGNWQAILNIAGFIRSVKSIAKLLVSAISPSFSSIVSDFKNSMQEMVEVARQKGYEAGKGYSENYNAGANNQAKPTGGSNSALAQQSWLSARMIGDKSGKTSWGSNSWNGSKMAGRVQIGGQLIGSAASIIGSSIAKDNQRAGAYISHVGSIAQGASMGAALGPWGAVIGGVVGGLASLPAVLDAFDPASVLKEKLKKAEEALTEANIERATKREEARNLEATINNLEKLQKARYSSEEAEQAFIDASNAAFEQFPQLLSNFDDAGNAIIDVISNAEQAERMLIEARQEAADATYKASAAELSVARAKQKQAQMQLDNYEGAMEALLYDSEESGDGDVYEISHQGYEIAKENYYKWTLGDFSEKYDTPLADLLAKTVGFGRFELGGTFEDGFIDFANTIQEVSGIDILSKEYADSNLFELLEVINTIVSTPEFNALFDSDADDGLDVKSYRLMPMLRTYGLIKEGETIDDVLGNYNKTKAEIERTDANAYASERATVRDYADTIVEQIDSKRLEKIDTLSGVTSLLKSSGILTDEMLASGQYFDEITEGQWDLTVDAKEKIRAYVESMEDSLTAVVTNLTNNYSLDDFNSLLELSDKQSVSWTDYQNEFKELFGENWLADTTSEQYTALKAYYDKYQQVVDDAKERLITALKSSEIWTNPDTAFNLDAIAPKYYDQIAEFNQSLTQRMEKGAITKTQAQDFANQYLNFWTKLNEQSENLTEEQIANAQKLLADASANGSMFSYTGIYTLIDELKKLGVNLDIDSASIKIPAANLVTEWATLEDKLASSLTSAAEVLQKASSGMDLDEALSLAKRADMDFAADFQFIGGKWYTSNIEAIKTYYTRQGDELSKLLQEKAQAITESGILSKVTNIDQLTQIKEADSFAAASKIVTGITEETWQAIKTYWDADKYKEWAQIQPQSASTSIADYWQQYFTNLGKIVDDATTKALEYWTKETEKQAKEAMRLASLKSQSQIQADKISAYKIIASQGTKGYSAEDLNTLIGSLSWDDSYYSYNSAIGAYNLTEKALNSIPLIYRNQIIASIDAEVQAATEAIESLGNNIFEATDADYSEAFSYLVKAGFQGKDIKKGINYALMEAVISDPKQLEEYIGRELAHKMGRDYTDEFAAEFDSEITVSQEEMTAAFKDSYIKRIQTYNDLVYKKIVGTATFAELEQLDEVSVELDIDLSQFTGRLIDDLAIYAQGIIDNAYLSAKEKNKYLKDSFNTMLGAKAYAKVYGVDANYLTQDAATRMEEFSAANKTLRSTKNRMTQSQASEAAAAYANLIGIDPMIVASMFDYNQSDSTFSYDSSLGTTARDIQLNTLWKVAEQNKEVMAALTKQEIDSAEALIGIISQSDMERVIAAISETGNLEALNVLGNYRYFEELAAASKQAEILGSETRANKYASAIQQFASGQEMTFEQLVTLYSDLGQTIGDPDKLYDLWLKGPKALEEELATFAANDQTLTGEQKEAIRQAQQAGVDALLSTITAAVNKAVSGTATLDDLYTIAKNTGIDLTGLVSKTGSGYGLNQQGLLAVAAARAQKNGDYSGEAAKLIKTYAGKGGIFGNAKALDNMLTAMRKAVDDTQTLINNAEAQAIKDVEQEDILYKKEKESLEKQKELQEAQVQILEQAQQAFKLNDAKNAANFMGADPFGGALKDYDNYVNSHKAAQGVLKAAYSNGGIIANYKQAGQLLNFIGYGQDWTQNETNKNLNTLLKHTTNKGTDFAAAYREIFGLGDTLSNSQVLLKAAELMDKAAEKMQKELDARIKANEAFADWHEKTVTDTTKRVALTEEQVKNQLLETKTEGDKTSTTLKTDSLISHITGKYMTTLENGKQVGITEATIKEIAATRYGSNWEADLADAGKLTSFLSDIDSLFTNFKYDRSSDLSYEEQFASYAKGEAAAQEVEERLNQLSDQIKGIVTDERQMEPLIAGIDKAIQKAEYLNRLLVGSQSGHAYTTGYNKEHGYTGVIYTDASNLTDQDNKGTEAIIAGLKETYGLSKDWAKTAQIEQDPSDGSYYIAYKHMVKDAEGKEVLDPSKSFRYTFRSKDQLAATGADPNAEFKVTGQFEEVDKWIAENKHIEAIYTLTTPEDAKAKLREEIKKAKNASAAQQELEYARMEGMPEDSEAFKQLKQDADEAAAAMAVLAQMEAELADLEARYPNEEDSTVQLKVTGTAPESDAELIKWKKDLAKALEGAGNVELTIIDDKGNIITDISSITKGQQITISASLADGSSEEEIKALVDSVNEITGGLEKPTVKIEVTGLTADTVTTVTDLTAALTTLNGVNVKAINVTLPGGAEAATTAQSIYDNLTNVNGKNYSATMKLTVQAVDSKGSPIVFDENGLVINNKKEETLTEEVKTLTAYNEELIAENTNLNRQLAEESKKKALLEASNINLQEQLTNSENEVAVLKEQLATQETKIATQQAGIESLTQQATTQESQLESKAEQIASLSAEKANLETQLTDAQSNIASLTTQITALESQNAQLSAEIVNLNNQISAKESNETALSEQIANLEKTIAANQLTIDSLKLALFSAQQEKTALEAELASYQSNEGKPVITTSTAKTDLDSLEGLVDLIGDYLVSQQNAIFETESPYAKRWKELNEDGLYQEMQRKAEGYWYNQDTGAIHRYTAEEQAEGQAYLEEYASVYASVLAFEEQQDAQWQALDAQLTELYNIYEKIEEERAKDGDSEESQITIAGLMDQLNSFIFGMIPGGTTEQTANVTTEANTEPFEKSADEIIAELEAMGAILPIEADTDGALSAAELVQRRINGLYAYLKVYAQYAGATGFPDGVDFTGDGGSEDGPGEYTGNVNGIAYADGNVDSLIAGAHLAHKTLVGELGPELGVWDGMYHLLGQNGAEFVNMPDDAIVFNHRQTEGILKGQAGYRGKALADGNITGPARVNDKTITPPWATEGGYAEFLELLGKSGSKTYKFTDVGDLKKWYNLLRKIAKLEKEITLEQAKRENMLDGHDWLKSYREEQSYLHEQIAVQKLLIDYQKEQLALERERIEQDEWWSHSLTFNEDGTLLSVFGNEVGGGEGAFAYLDMLNNLSGNEQVAALKKLGYSYVGKDGKALEGEELVKKFIKEYTEIVGGYNKLDDSILDAETKIEKLTKTINKFEQKIKENQKGLEKTIYDLLVDAAKKEMEQTKEQNELLKEANKKYIDGLSEALNKERQLYEKNKSIEEREALQRQLSLLRRSGGSASEIEALEQQLDDTLKNEYFNKQQQMIEDISKANERQAELMEQQVKLQEEALEYQKENGVIWTKVYEVMSGSYEEILTFLTGQDTKFFEASALVQETMLLDWAKMVGIYDEDRAGKIATKTAEGHWTNGTMEEMFTEDTDTVKVGNNELTRQDQYNALSDTDKKAAQEHYNTAFTNAILEGKTEEEARQIAYNSMVERFRTDGDDAGITRFDPRGDGAGTGSDNSSGSYTGKNVYFKFIDKDSKQTITTKSKWYKYGSNILYTYGLEYTPAGYTASHGDPISITNFSDKSQNIITYYCTKKTTATQQGQTNSAVPSAEQLTREIETLTAQLNNAPKTSPAYESMVASVKMQLEQKKAQRLQFYGYSEGGLVDYTGVAMVHGSKSKPESFLNAEQTAQITAALRETTGKQSVLASLQSTMDKLKSVIHNFSTVDNSTAQSISIAPGAVVIQVEQLADSYDIEEVSRDVMNRMVAIANKTTNRGVNRR